MLVRPNTDDWNFWKKSQMGRYGTIQKRIRELKFRNKTKDEIRSIVSNEYNAIVPYKVNISDDLEVTFDPSFMDEQK